jgi:hypothetical protein
MVHSDRKFAATPTQIRLRLQIQTHLRIRTPSVIRAQAQARTPLARENEIRRGGYLNELAREHHPALAAPSPRLTIRAEAEAETEDGNSTLLTFTNSP